MKNSILSILFLFVAATGFAQEANPNYDEKLAKSLNADERGMKQYVFCILKTGSNTTATAEEKNELFKGHMANITKLAKEGKLALAGPFMKNDKNYRGLYIFNVGTIEEAKELVATDPAVKANVFEAELTPWYGTAALQETLTIHEKITKNKL